MDLTRGQKILVLIGLTAVLLGVLVLSFSRARRPAAAVTYVAPAAQSPSQTQVAVHVAGAVNHPGMYWMTSGARVADAIALAGGLRGDADPGSVNLAAPIQDGQQVLVASTTPEMAPAAPVAPAVQPPPPAPELPTPSPAVPAAAQPPRAPQVVSLNQATKPQLEALPGIGPELAARILYYRYENGPFRAVDDLLKVEGIGHDRLEALRPFVRP